MPEMLVQLKDGSAIRGSSVLSTIAPKEAVALLQPSISRSEEALFARTVPIKAACLDLVMDGMPRPKVTFAMGADSPWYFSNHSASASLTDNPRHAVVHAMKYGRPGEQSDSGQDERELSAFMDLIQPGWRAHVIKRRFMPSLLVAHDFAEATRGGYTGRAACVVSGWPGLFIAGDWVGGEGSLLNASLASAKQAAEKILASPYFEQRQVK